MKNLNLTLLTIVTISLSQSSIAQDSLYTTDGKSAAVKIIEVNGDNLKYKKFSNIDGPTYTVEKSSVMHVRYKNGEDEVYQKQDVVVVPK